VAKVAMSHGLNANMVHGCRKLAGERDVSAVVPAPSPAVVAAKSAAAMPQFVPVSLTLSPSVGSAAAGRYPDRTAPWRHGHEDHLADRRSSRLRSLDARVAEVIRIDSLWLAVEPMEMRAGADRLLASVVQVFGSAQAHHGYQTSLVTAAQGVVLKAPKTYERVSF